MFQLELMRIEKKYFCCCKRTYRIDFIAIFWDSNDSFPEGQIFTDITHTFRESIVFVIVGIRRNWHKSKCVVIKECVGTLVLFPRIKVSLKKVWLISLSIINYPTVCLFSTELLPNEAPILINEVSN